jgi:hypothetical protein
MQRDTFKQAVESILLTEGSRRAYWRAMRVEHALHGVFTARELVGLTTMLDSSAEHQYWDAVVPVGPFSDLPDGPRVTRNTVAQAAAALQGRLLALEPAGQQENPDRKLGANTHYSPEQVRKALQRTLAALDLGGLSRRGRYAHRATGSTKLERERQAQRRQHAEAAQRRRALAQGRTWIEDPGGETAWDVATPAQRAAALERERVREEREAVLLVEFNAGKVDAATYVAQVAAVAEEVLAGDTLAAR